MIVDIPTPAGKPRCRGSVDRPVLALMAPGGVVAAVQPATAGAMGIDHVRIGSDLPAGAAGRAMPNLTRHQRIAAALRERGMRGDEMDKLCAGDGVFRAARA